MDQSGDLRSLAEIGTAILEGSTHEARQGVHDLNARLRQASSVSPGFSFFDLFHLNAFLNPRGVKIRPFEAADCLMDIDRTIAFARGSIEAVTRKLKSPDSPVHFLEAGCGPYAPFALLVASKFGPHLVRVSVADYYPNNLLTVRRIFEQEGLSSCLERTFQGDLCKETFPNYQADVLALEVTGSALLVEPQVEAAHHLTGIFPNALLLPEEIAVDVNQGSHNLGNIARINRDFLWNSLAWPIDYVRRTSGTFPLIPEGHHELFLSTRIRVFGDHIIEPGQSIITDPYILSLCPKDARFVDIKYRFGEVLPNGMQVNFRR